VDEHNCLAPPLAAESSFDENVENPAVLGYHGKASLETEGRTEDWLARILQAVHLARCTSPDYCLGRFLELAYRQAVSGAARRSTQGYLIGSSLPQLAAWREVRGIRGLRTVSSGYLQNLPEDGYGPVYVVGI
jgi:hypothetical protein